MVPSDVRLAARYRRWVLDVSRALLLLLPGVVLLGARWARRAVRDPILAGLLTPLVALVSMLLAVHMASLAASSFHTGLLVGISVLGVAGYVGWVADRGKAQDSGLRAEAHDGDAASMAGQRRPWVVIVVAVAAAAWVAPGVWMYAYHDELPWLGHFSMTSGIATGWYPPRHVTFPDFPLKYHYGFDLLAACVMRLFAVGVERAIDLTSLALFAYSGVLAWIVAGQLIGRPAPGWTPLIFLFAAGLPGLAPELFSICEGIEATCEWMSMRSAGTSLINPPFVSNFFQHPWGLGVPVSLGLWAVVLDRPQAEPAAGFWAWAGLAAALTALLSLAQVVLFLGLVGALVGAAAFEAVRARSLNRARAALPLIVGAATAPLLGGFFVSGQMGAQGSLVWATGGIAGDIGSSLLWHLATFGLMIPLAAYGWGTLGRGRSAIALFIVGNLLVANLLRYRFSWDIVKFITAASMATALLSVAGLARLSEKSRPLLRVLAVVTAFGVVAFGGGYQVPFNLGWTVPHPRAPRGGDGPYPGLAPADADVLNWLRVQADPTDLVYRAPAAAQLYAYYGGIPQVVANDVGTEGFGFAEERLVRRRAFRRGLPPCSTLRAERVRWVVVDRATDPPAVRGPLEAMKRDGLAVEMHAAGELRVLRIEYERCMTP